MNKLHCLIVWAVHQRSSMDSSITSHWLIVQNLSEISRVHFLHKKSPVPSPYTFHLFDKLYCWDVVEVNERFSQGAVLAPAISILHYNIVLFSTKIYWNTLHSGIQTNFSWQVRISIILKFVDQNFRTLNKNWFQFSIS